MNHEAIVIQAAVEAMFTINPRAIKTGWRWLNIIRQARAAIPGSDLFADLTPEIYFPACRARWNWFKTREAEFTQWWASAGSG